MTVVQLWNMWANWNAFTTVILQTDGGDEIGVFQHHEDVLNLFVTKKCMPLAVTMLKIL